MASTLFDDLEMTEVPVATRKPKHRPTLPPKPDPIADTLLQHGLVPNTFVLDLNHGLTIPHDLERPYPWSLPSRLFIFPVEVTSQAADGSRKIGLLHPLLAEHPFVKRLEALGVTPDPNGAPNDFGYRKRELGQWWHAVDLISSGQWQDLLRTAQFTTPNHIASAVSFGLQYSPSQGKKRSGHISTLDARKIMAALGSAEPDDPDGIVREHFMPPSPSKSEKGAERWPVNHHVRNQMLTAWGHILGIEAGWIAHDRSGFLGWARSGIERFQPSPRVESEIQAYMPPAPLGPAVLAQEVSPRPQARPNPQMSLF